MRGFCASTPIQANQMLDFAARHNISPMVEELAMTDTGISEATEMPDAGKVRHRAVLKVQQ